MEPDTETKRTGAPAVADWLLWPFRRMRDVFWLRQLRRRWPSVHRRLVHTPRGARRETDAEFLERLIQIDSERAED